METSFLVERSVLLLLPSVFVNRRGAETLWEKDHCALVEH
jgi:hypothetical protein